MDHGVEVRGESGGGVKKLEGKWQVIVNRKSIWLLVMLDPQNHIFNLIPSKIQAGIGDALPAF